MDSRKIMISLIALKIRELQLETVLAFKAGTPETAPNCDEIAYEIMAALEELKVIQFNANPEVVK